jgi:hypothetical protein
MAPDRSLTGTSIMNEKVLKPFKSAIHRFKVGDPVTQQMIAPLDFRHLQSRGFVSGGAAPANEAVPMSDHSLPSASMPRRNSFGRKN